MPLRLRWTNVATGKTIDIPLDFGEELGSGVLPSLSNIAEIAGGTHHAVASDRDGGIWAWGHNAFGQLLRFGCLRAII